MYNFFSFLLNCDRKFWKINYCTCLEIGEATLIFQSDQFAGEKIILIHLLVDIVYLICLFK